MSASASLSRELADWSARIEDVARGFGLDFFDVVFEMVDPRDVNALAAYAGFPVRYPSWRFGMDFERLDKGSSWGLSKIYELVVNTDPARAWLVRTNSLMEQKLVMAHVCGHADFFKNNVWFQPTDRRMNDTMQRHADRVRALVDLLGQDKVETFLDRALSLDNLVDPFLPLREHLRRQTRRPDEAGGAASFEQVRARSAARESARPPTYDVLGFLLDRAPLEPWQHEIVALVRAEAQYFVPQRTTKIMNEGWASFWHSRILTTGVLGPSEIVDFADCHSGATAAGPSQLNPYKLGIELFRAAEERGYDLFRLRRAHNDASLIDEIVDERFAARNSLFLFGKSPRSGRTEVLETDWRAVKQKLLQELAWGGLPQIEIVDDDHGGTGELVLQHHHDGRDLELSAAGETMKHLASLWGRRVHLLTQEENTAKRLSTDGKSLSVADVATVTTAATGS